MSIIAAIQWFFAAIAKFFDWVSDGRLIDLGERRAEDRQREVAEETKKRAEAIDSQPIADRPTVLDGLRPPRDRPRQ